MIKGYVINLDKDYKRLQAFYSHSDSCHIFKRFPAIDKRIIELTNNKSFFFDVDFVERTINREITWGEIACTLSHIGCWDMINRDESIKEDEFVLIAEDDISLLNNYTDYIHLIITSLKEVQLYSHIELVILQKLALQGESIDWSALFENRNELSFLQYNKDSESLYDNDGSGLYLIRKSLAKRIIHRLCSIKPYWLADHFTAFCKSENIVISNPLLGMVNPIFPSNLDEERVEARRRTRGSL